MFLKIRPFCFKNYCNVSICIYSYGRRRGLPCYTILTVILYEVVKCRIKGVAHWSQAQGPLHGHYLIQRRIQGVRTACLNLQRRIYTVKIFGQTFGSVASDT